MLNQTSSEAHKFKLTALFLNRESDKVFFGRCARRCSYTCASRGSVPTYDVPKRCHQLLIYIRTSTCVRARRWIFGKAMDSKEQDEAGRV